MTSVIGRLYVRGYDMDYTDVFEYMGDMLFFTEQDYIVKQQQYTIARNRYYSVASTERKLANLVAYENNNIAKYTKDLNYRSNKLAFITDLEKQVRNGDLNGAFTKMTSDPQMDDYLVSIFTDAYGPNYPQDLQDHYIRQQYIDYKVTGKVLTTDNIRQEYITYKTDPLKHYKDVLVTTDPAVLKQLAKDTEILASRIETFGCMIPLVETYCDYIHATTGKEVFTGNDLSGFDRGITTAAIFIPFIGGSAASKSDEAVEFVGKNTDDLLQNSKIIDNLGLYDGMRIDSDSALDLAEDFLGKGYMETFPGSGRYVSADGTRVVRMKDGDILGQHGGGSHMNFETLTPNPDKVGKMMVDQNLHIYLID